MADGTAVVPAVPVTVLSMAVSVSRTATAAVDHDTCASVPDRIAIGNVVAAPPGMV